MSNNSAVSSGWVLNALAGMSFPEPGQAYEYMKKCLDSSQRAQTLVEACEAYNSAEDNFIRAKNILIDTVCPENVKLVQDAAQVLQDRFTTWQNLLQASQRATNSL